MSPSTRSLVRALLAATGLVLVGGVALAVVQPGDLGDDDAETTAPETTTTTLDGTTTTSEGTTTTTEAAATTTTADAGAGAAGSTTTTVGSTTSTTPASTTSTTTAAGSSTTTTAPESGIGNDGPSVSDDGTATTGMESMLGPALALAGVAALARAASRRRTT